MPMSGATAVFMISLSAIPLTYIVNTASTLHGEFGLLVSGVVCLSFICWLTHYLVGRKGYPTDPLFYGISLVSFGGVVSLIIALEDEGVVEGFMDAFLKHGEPSLKSAHGTLMCYWSGSAQYALSLMLGAALSEAQSYREVGLYWAGSIGHSMVVFIPGNLVGKYGIRWSFLLNVPYIIIPFIAGARFLRERSTSETEAIEQDKQGGEEERKKSIWKRPLDLVFVLSLVVFAAVALLRAFAVLGCRNDLIHSYMTDIEPYLDDPVAYPKIQMLVYFFYYIPYYVMAVYGLLYPGCSWMPDWSLIHAGAATQGQIAHIGASLHYRTPYVLRVPPDGTARLIFWSINLALLILPQLLAYRCQQCQRFFQQPVASADSPKQKIKSQ